MTQVKLARGEVTLNISEEHFFPWSPDSPFLYDLTVGTTQGEEEGFDTCLLYTSAPATSARTRPWIT